LFATIDRYVLREVAIALAGVTVVLLAILVSYQLARILGIAAEHGFPHDIVLALIGLTTLENLMVLVPISMLLAAMLALGRLYHESEMAAVRACGIGPERLYLPVYALAVPVAIGLAWLTFVVGPEARNGAEELRGRGMRDAQFGMLTPGGQDGARISCIAGRFDIRKGIARVAASGSLNGQAGSGSWKLGILCSGRWTAQKRGPVQASR